MQSRPVVTHTRKIIRIVGIDGIDAQKEDPPLDNHDGAHDVHHDDVPERGARRCYSCGM